MPKMHIEKSVKIEKPVAEVYNLLNNFDNWTPWSPWLITDPDAKVTVAEDKKSYEWTGPVTGDGNMKIYGGKENERIDIDLTFLKPWKSTAKVWFDLNTEGAGTRVKWGMDSKIPFFIFFMKNLMESMIGMDYDRGLSMLKEFAETGKVSSELDIVGKTNFPGGKYIGIKTSTSMDKMGESMEKDFTKLLEHVKGSHENAVAGNPFSIYHKWDPVKKQAEYTAAIPVNSKVDLLSGMFEGEYPATEMFTIHHTGKYEYAGNPWSAAWGRKQAKIIKANKKLHPIEEYLNSPKDTDPEKLETRVHMAIK